MDHFSDQMQESDRGAVRSFGLAALGLRMIVDLVWPRLCQGVGLRTAPQVQTAMTSEAAGHGAGGWGYIRPEGGVAMAPQ